MVAPLSEMSETNIFSGLEGGMSSTSSRVLNVILNRLKVGKLHLPLGHIPGKKRMHRVVKVLLWFQW